MSSSLRDSEQADLSDAKTQECMETQELSSQESDCLQSSVTKFGPQGAPVLPSIAPKHPESCNDRSSQGDADSPTEKGKGVNGPVACKGDTCTTAETLLKPSSPARRQNSEAALPNHVDIKTESSGPFSSCMQRDTPSTSLLSDSPARHHSSTLGNFSSGLNSSLSSQSKGIKVHIFVYIILSYSNTFFCALL